MSSVSIPSATSMIRYDDELKRRLEKLSRTYDLTTMKIFICVECLGEYFASERYRKLRVASSVNKPTKCAASNLVCATTMSDLSNRFLKVVSENCEDTIRIFAEHLKMSFYGFVLRLNNEISRAGCNLDQRKGINNYTIP